MLEDFGHSGGARAGTFGASLAVALLVYGAIGAGVVMASAIVRRAIVEDDLVQLELAPPPEPPPPPPPPPPPVAPPPVEAAPARLGRQMRPELEMPTEIPDEAPEESDEPLPPPPDPFAPEEEGDPNGVEGGVLGGAVGGAGSEAAAAPPEPAPEPAARPSGPVRVLEGTTPPQVDRAALVSNFEIPPEVRSAGIARITLVVRVTIGDDGTVTHVDVLRGHALIPDETIVRAVERTHFDPARMSDGTPYAAIHTLPITLAITL